MNWISKSSNTGPNVIEDPAAGHLRTEMDLYLNNADLPQRHFLEAFFKSLLAFMRDKVARSQVPLNVCALEQQGILRLASTHLFQNWKGDLNKGISCLNDAIFHLNRAGIITIPLIDSSSILIKKTTRQAVAINETCWLSYLKVESLYDFFVNHFELQDDEEELSHAAMFSMIVSGCHFHKSYLSIIDASLSDFNPAPAWVMLEKKLRKKRSPKQVKVRFFVSAVSIVLVLRLINLALDRIISFDDKLFPQSLMGRKRTGHEFSRKFKAWLDRLVSAFNTHRSKQGDHGFYGISIESIKIRELYEGAQIWTALRYPLFETSYLSQKVVPGQLSSVNYRALSSDDHPPYTTKLSGSSGRRSWTNVKPTYSTDTERELSDDSYDQLRNIHSAVAHVLQHGHGNISKKERAHMALEIKRLAETLPYPSSTLSQMENGYLSNYRLLLEWLAAMVQIKDKVETAFDYFSDLANMFYFVLGDTSIISLAQYELSDVVFEIIQFNASPRTQRGSKNKIRQFLSFLRGRYPLPKLNWNHPDYWIIDEPIEREIMGFSEFDTVCEEMEKTVSPEQAESLKAVLILLFYAGLRIHEAALLSHDAIYIDLELNIFVKKSKTRSGKRSLPLHYLLPDKQLKFFRDYVLKRRPKGPRSGIPLFSLDGVSFPDPKVLADMITDVIFECLGRHITCHQLRHSFASLLLVRWYALLYGTETMELSSEDRSHPAVTEMGNLRKLFLGEGPEKVGDKYFMHAIIAAGRLLGHAGPVTTVNVYIHTIDVLYHWFLAENDATSFVTVSRAAKMLGISYPTAKKLAGDNNMVSLSAMGKYCLTSYKLPGSKV